MAGGPDAGPQEEAGMSEPTSEQRSEPDEAGASGATDEPGGNLTVEDDAEGTTNPADLAGTGDPGDDGVD